jgi:hypothetical protein
MLKKFYNLVKNPVKKSSTNRGFWSLFGELLEVLHFESQAGRGFQKLVDFPQFVILRVGGSSPLDYPKRG